MSVLYTKHNYTRKDITIIRNTMIREYDIKSAGLNILYNKEYVDEETYNHLMSIDKLERNIIIGKWLRENTSVNKEMMDEFIRIRKAFFEMNNLEDDNVLAIKKDAIFVIDRVLSGLQFENYLFVAKDEYTDFILMNKKEYYYNKYTNELVVKGFSQETKEFQKDYYFLLIKTLLNIPNPKDRFKCLIIFKDDFLNRRLSKEYYKSIESNAYLFKMAGSLLGMDDIPDNLLPKVFLGYNIAFINYLISIFIV